MGVRDEGLRLSGIARIAPKSGNLETEISDGRVTIASTRSDQAAEDDGGGRGKGYEEGESSMSL